MKVGAEEEGVGCDRHPLGVIRDFPPILYKYRTWSSEQHRDMLTKNHLFFASPEAFNDPFDCAIPLRYEKATAGQMNEFLKACWSKQSPHLTKAEINKRVIAFLSSGKHRDPQILKEVRELEHGLVCSSVGICALTSHRDNMVMWSHYADSHCGFCVGFDTRKLLDFSADEYRIGGLQTYLQKVQYAEEFPYIDAFGDDPAAKVLKRVNTKSSHWAYEDEYRFFLFGQTNRIIPMRDEFFEVLEVILGCNMDKENGSNHKDEIRRTLAKRKRRVKLLQAVKKTHDFGIEFLELDY